VTRPSLGEQGCQQVHVAALRLLGDVGCVVLDPEAHALLEAHGAVAEGERVRFGEELVAEALATVPAGYTVAGRRPELDLRVALDAPPVLASASGPPFVLDGGEQRPGTLEDLRTAIALAHLSPNIAVHGYSVEPTDVPEDRRARMSAHAHVTGAKCITGLIAADSGAVSFEGKLLKPTASRRSQAALRAIQMVFQNPDSTLNPAWSTRAILARAVRKLSGGSTSAVRARVDELAADVRVEPRFLLQKPMDLSGGQKQRIAIARAFAGEPTLVVCDEPASALDVSVQASILNLLVELQASAAVSYIFISHDLAVVRYLSDRIGVMYLAELIEVGSAEEVFSPPHHPYTEALLSSIPTFNFDNPQQRIALRGTMPSLSEPPSGCRFHTRCHRILGDICVEQEPPLQVAATGHTYKCHIPPDELLEAQHDKKHDTRTGHSPAGGPEWSEKQEIGGTS